MPEKLELKPIINLLGKDFFIPNYQRGYRWTTHQVTDLLEDIWGFAQKKDKEDEKFYCLQPIVVKTHRNEENCPSSLQWEVVDGQQRLTTIYLILRYMAKAHLKVEKLSEEYENDLYTIEYETRPGSREFLENIRKDDDNIDFYYIWHAYNAIEKWFSGGTQVKDRTDRDLFLSTLLGREDHKKSVKIIWYHVDDFIDGRELFTRLNMGKIALTNAELIKALFLSETSFEHAGYSDGDILRKRCQISLMWDEMEQALSNKDFWAFITNKKASDYPNKIELIFDMIAEKKEKDGDPLHTFLYFLNETKTQPRELWTLWLSIEWHYRMLQEWYINRSWYHKVGYLVAIGKDLRFLIEQSRILRKDSFDSALDAMIRESVNEDLDSLRYNEPSGYKAIEKILLLFNVETVRKNENITEFYPFYFHKSINWSLEHIHAQNSEGLDKTKKKPWMDWLFYHKELLVEQQGKISDKSEKACIEKLIAQIDEMKEDKITWEKFDALSREIIGLFSESGEEPLDDMHHISNMALLSQPDNAALNNSVFEVKRRQILKMDRDGVYVPICTRRVFFKYYNESASGEQLYFWGREDRKNYVAKIREILFNYLPDSKNMEA